MKKLIIIIFLSLNVGFLQAQVQTINNLETGLVVRNKLNSMFGQIYDNLLNMQFSADGSTNWHDTYSTSDNYYRVSRDIGITWSSSIPLTNALEIQFSADGVTYSYTFTAGDTYIRYSTDGGTTWSDGLLMSDNYLVEGDSLTTYITPTQLGDSLDAREAVADNQTIDVLELSGDTLYLSLESDGEATKETDLSNLSDIDSVYVERLSNFPIDKIKYTKDGTVYDIGEIPKPNGLVSGGLVSWVDSLKFTVSPAAYYINGTLHTTETTALTLSDADATHPRTDVIVVDTTETANVVEGTPAASPQKPSVNPQFRIELTNVLILAGDTVPSDSDGNALIDSLVYDENVEWTGSVSGVVGDFAATTSPQSGTYCAEISTVDNGDQIIFTNTDTVYSTDFETFSFYLKLKAVMTKKHSFWVRFALAGVDISNEIELPVNKDSTTWQNIAVPLSQFAFISTGFDEVRLTWKKINPNTTHTGFYIDVVRLQGGVTPPITNTEETDPIYSAWDKSTGISITESQISDFGAYLESEVDGSITNEIQTIDVSQLVGTELQLSLENDGEVTKTVDLSSLQDGTGTDDQTAVEVPITDAGGYFDATEVETALQEIGADIASGGDNWGTQVVVSDVSLSGTGVTGSELSVDDSQISIPASQVSDFDTEVSNNTSVAANTTKTGNATHTGEVIGATALTIASNVVDYDNLAATLKQNSTDNDGAWDFGGSGIITAAISSNTTVSFTNKLVNKYLCIKLTLSSSATITWPTEAKILDGSATLADGTFYIYLHCISTTEITVSITK